jgi:hypothetical protein
VVIRASETDLAVLDLRQERNARALGDGHRIPVLEDTAPFAEVCTSRTKGSPLGEMLFHSQWLS